MTQIPDEKICRRCGKPIKECCYAMDRKCEFLHIECFAAEMRLVPRPRADDEEAA